MRPDVEAARQLLRAANPRPDVTLTPAEAERAERDLQAILSGQRGPVDPPGRPVLVVRRRRRVLLVSLVVAVLAFAGFLVGVPGNQQTPALAQTPPPLDYQPVPGETATSLLHRLADRAATTTPDEPAAAKAAASTPRVDHLVVYTWDLATSMAAPGPAVAIEPTRTELWRTPDGTGRLVRWQADREFPDPADRRAWTGQGLPTSSSGTDREVLTLSRAEWMWPGRPPKDPEALRQWLQRGHPASNGPAETLVAVADLAAEQVLSPAARAALLRVLADVPGLQFDGRTRDRLGRPGFAVSLTSTHTGLPTRHTLILSADGQLLGYERMLTTDAGALPVRVPAVIGYTAFSVADHVAQVPRPDQ